MYVRSLPKRMDDVHAFSPELAYQLQLRWRMTLGVHGRREESHSQHTAADCHGERVKAKEREVTETQVLGRYK